LLAFYSPEATELSARRGYRENKPVQSNQREFFRRGAHDKHAVLHLRTAALRGQKIPNSDATWQWRFVTLAKVDAELTRTMKTEAA